MSEKIREWKILRAIPADADGLTRIAHTAKRHWGYPEKWIAQWRTLLTITPEYISRNECFVALSDASQLGFYGLRPAQGSVQFEHLWVLPPFMGRGLGRALFIHALKTARQQDFTRLEIEADPNAAGFYERMGCQRTGTVISEVDGHQRQLPVFLYQLDSAVY